jgi:hypothetical protein
MSSATPAVTAATVPAVRIWTSVSRVSATMASCGDSGDSLTGCESHTRRSVPDPSCDRLP